LTNRSIELVPNNAYGYAAKAMYLIFSNRPREALEVTDAGLGRNPNSSMLYLQRSKAEISFGRFEQAKSDAQQALKLEPRGPLSMWGLQQLGDAELACQSWGVDRGAMTDRAQLRRVIEARLKRRLRQPKPGPYLWCTIDNRFYQE
jgi:tetratricopeptide (TPR) repeat protein